jgi:hypothetical protein
MPKKPNLRNGASHPTFVMRSSQILHRSKNGRKPGDLPMQNTDAQIHREDCKPQARTVALYEWFAEHNVVLPVFIELVASHPSGGAGGEARGALPVDGRQGI